MLRPPPRSTRSDTRFPDTPLFRSAKTTDHDWRPNATARLRIGDGIQIRLGDAKSLRRPNFGALNPAVTLNHSNNPLVQSGGSAGNPDLKVQKSPSYDATFEYSFPRHYVDVAGFYRAISVLVIHSAVVDL